MAGSKAVRSGGPRKRRKKPYARPRLTEYGSVSKLTMVKGSTTTEFVIPKIKKSCL